MNSPQSFEDFAVNVLQEECKVDREFGLQLFEHFKNKDRLMTNDEATARLFQNPKDSKEHASNRKEINKFLEKQLKNPAMSGLIQQIELKSSGERKKSIKGYQFTFDIYKMMLLKFEPASFTYYLKLESLAMRWIAELEK